MSWNHRSGRQDWDSPRQSDHRSQARDSEAEWSSWPSAKDDRDQTDQRQGWNRNNDRDYTRSNHSDYNRDDYGHTNSETRMHDHRRSRDFNDKYNNSRNDSDSGRWKHDKYEENPRNKRRGNYDRRDNYDDRRDSNWQKGGSWGNVNRHEQRDRSRSPPRYNDNRNRNDDKRHDSGHYEGRGSRRNDDKMWPDRPAESRNNYRGQRNEPKTTLIVKGVPQGMTSDMIKTELENKSLHVRSCQVSTTREPGEWNGVGYIEMGRVPDAAHIIENCKGLVNVDGYQLTFSYADTSSLTSSRSGSSHGGGHVQRYEGGHGGGRPNNFPTEPTDTMIVRNLDFNSTEKSIADAFGYITKKNILDIRLTRDRNTGQSRGFAFITWGSVNDCKQVLEYLQKATPKFNVDGVVVMLDYANGLPNKHRQEELKVKAANDAIAAAQSIKKSWEDPNRLTNGKAGLMKQTATDQGIAPHMTPHLYPLLPADIGTRAPPAGMIPPIPPDQLPPLTDADGRYRKYPNPNYSLFQWLGSHQMYYDPCTGLMWDHKVQKFYNQYKQLYLYWDETQDTFCPVQNQMNHIPVASPVQQIPGTVTKNETGKKAKASDIQKQMDSWMKSQKKTKNKPMSVEEADALRRQKKMQHSSFAAGAFGSTFQSKSLQAPIAAVHPPPPPPPSDMFSEPPKTEPLLEPVKKEESIKDEPGYGDEESYLDWTTFKCLLCRRAFNDAGQLTKHKDKSKLHKENLDKLRHPEPEEPQDSEDESDAYRAVMQIQQAMGSNSYRDRAKERRSKFGDDIPPGVDPENYEDFSGPAEQPTKHGIGAENKGAQLLAKMGWTGGTGLGKNRDGIVNPIEAGEVRENKTAGLGTRANARTTPRSGEQYKKKIRQLTQDRWNDAGHG